MTIDYIAMQGSSSAIASLVSNSIDRYDCNAFLNLHIVLCDNARLIRTTYRMLEV
jgi:hypothetical protein